MQRKFLIISINFYDTMSAMKSKLVQILLLCVMTFNLLHASIITEPEVCQHDCHYTQHEKQNDFYTCNTCVDLHHLFHLSAVLASSTALVPLFFASLKPDANHLGFHPLFYEIAHKPPII